MVLPLLLLTTDLFPEEPAKVSAEPVANVTPAAPSQEAEAAFFTNFDESNAKVADVPISTAAAPVSDSTAAATGSETDEDFFASFGEENAKDIIAGYAGWMPCGRKMGTQRLAVDCL